MSSAFRDRYDKVREFFNPPLNQSPPNKWDWSSLRYLKWDLTAALVMCPVSYVFALSISNIATMSPMTGIFAGILGCWMLWLLRGSNLGIAGPAAALAPILAGAVAALGQGSLLNGQLMVLPVIFTAGLFMFLIASFKWARFTSMVSPAVVDGAILGYIGYSIVVRQIPVFHGVQFHEKSLSGILWETITFQHFDQINWIVFGIGALSLGIIIGQLCIQRVLEKNSTGRLKKILTVFPPQLIATTVAIGIGYQMTMDPKQMIHLPSVLTIDFALGLQGMRLLLAHKELWWKYALYSFKLTMVDTVETCATIIGIDNKDRYRRMSDPNRALMAMGIANMIGSPMGNQSHIPGGMKSGTNTVLGAKTRNAALFTGLLMAISIYFEATRNVIDHIPLVALSAVIGYAGYRLCAPNVWKHFWKEGRKQTFVFTWLPKKLGFSKPIEVTLPVTDTFIVFTGGFLISAMTGEILIGFFAAMLIEFFFTYKDVLESAKEHAHNGVETAPRSILRDIFRNPVVSAEMKNDVFTVILDGPQTNFNRRFIPSCPPEAREVFIDVRDPKVTYVHHSVEECYRNMRHTACGKHNFKLDGFRPACSSGRVCTGMVREVEEIEGAKEISSL